MLELCTLELLGVGDGALLPPDPPPQEASKSPRLGASKKEYFITVSRLWVYYQSLSAVIGDRATNMALTD